MRVLVFRKKVAMKVSRKVVFGLLLALIMLAGLNVEALASCPRHQQGPPCQEFWRADAVFIGVATKVVQTPNNTGLMIGRYLRTTVRFSVEEAFRGVEGSEVVLELDHCGHSFTEGERYLVYAHLNRNNNKLDVRAGSSRTRPLSEAGADLEYIRGLSSAEPGSRIFGKVAQYTLNIKENGFDIDPLESIKVTIDGNNQHQEAVTNKEGIYQFTGLAAGDYRIRVGLPAHLSADRQTITLTGRGCVPVNITARRNGQIAGRVLDMNGKPLASVPVSIVSAEASFEQVTSESKDKGDWTFGLTDEQGRYIFSQLAPGKYLLVINRAEFEKSRGTEIARTLPRLFYPGVSDIGQATIIFVREEQKPREYDFRLQTAQP
jgi:hypothetical protein